MNWELRLRHHYAIAVSPEWLERVMAQLRATHPDVSAWPEDRIFEKLFSAFLFCDLNQAGVATLPVNTQDMHKEVLKGKFVLQLDETVNMAAAARERYSEQAGNRCLKFALTDGRQQVFGVEHAHLPAFTWDCPAGSKVLIHNVPIRRGLLLLGPDNTALLGGQVDRLEAARQRAVAAWTKPVVGRPAGSAERDIFAEARQAAWDPEAPTGAQPQAALGTAGGGAGPPAGAQFQVGQVHAPPAGNAAGGPTTVAPGPAPAAAPPPQQHQPPIEYQQYTPVAQPPPQHMQPLVAAGAGLHGSMPAICALNTATGGPQLQQQAQGGSAHTHQISSQQPQQDQGWQQQQQQLHFTQPQPPTPSTQHVLHGVGPPWLGRSANRGFPVGETNNLTRSGSAVSGAWQQHVDPGTVGARESSAISSTALGIAAARNPGDGGGLNPGDGGGRGGTTLDLRGTASLPVELVSSSDSDSGRCPPRGGLGAAQDPHLLPRQHQLQQQQQPPLRRLPSSVFGANLLGGSGTYASAGGPSTSSGLFLSRPSNMQRMVTPMVTPNSALNPSPASGTAAGITTAGAVAPGSASVVALRKPMLLLARSSPGPSISSFSSGGRGGGGGPSLAPSPSTGTTGSGAGHRTSVGAGDDGAAGSRRIVNMALEVEMVDLATLDDDDGGDGGVGGSRGRGGSSHIGSAGWDQAATCTPPLDVGSGLQQLTQSGKVKLQQALDGSRERIDKRPRLELQQQGRGDANVGGRYTATATAVVPATMMNVDVDLPVADGPTLTQQQRQQHIPTHDHMYFMMEPSENFGMLDGSHNWTADRTCPAPAPNMEPAMSLAAQGSTDAALVAAVTQAQLEPAVEADNHAGAVLLCQLPDLLQPGLDADIPLTFPLTVDVYGLFYRVDGDTALVEDGTAVVEALLTTSALAPVLADAVPPVGCSANEPIGLEQIWIMADSPDPVIQAYGQALAERAMDFIRDFSGVIRLEYRAPLPTQPLIVRLQVEGKGGVGGGMALQGCNENTDSCKLYETHLRELGVLELGAEEAVALMEDE